VLKFSQIQGTLWDHSEIEFPILWFRYSIGESGEWDSSKLVDHFCSVEGVSTFLTARNWVLCSRTLAQYLQVTIDSPSARHGV
jgi:hypothetical protein